VQMDHAMSPSTAATPASPCSPASKWPSTLRTTRYVWMSWILGDLHSMMLLCLSYALHFAPQLKFGVDESYKLTVPATGSPIYAQIEVSKRLPLNRDRTNGGGGREYRRPVRSSPCNAEEQCTGAIPVGCRCRRRRDTLSFAA
jgi:hypothetical protein